MKTNRKGMTLVECIIAMGVFAIATTGFTMAATACVKAQTKYHTRNRITNSQTTNLEHFSNYKDVVDLSEHNVTSMDPDTGIGKNMYQMTFEFPSATVVNNKIHGYRSLVNDDEDGVFELSFFSPINQVSLEANEYWITLYNCSDVEVTWDISGESHIMFFDNEKNTTGNTLPRHIWNAGGEYKRFGVRDESNGSESLQITIKDPINNTSAVVPLGNKININGEEDRYGYIFYTGGNNFLSFDEYNPT